MRPKCPTFPNAGAGFEGIDFYNIVAPSPEALPGRRASSKVGGAERLEASKELELA